MKHLGNTMLIKEMHAELGTCLWMVHKNEKLQKYQISLTKLLLHQKYRILFKDPQSGKSTFQLKGIVISHKYLNVCTLTHKTCVFLWMFRHNFSVMVC